jgi:hypothetical protein
MTTKKQNEDNLSRGVDPLESQLTDALEAIPHVPVADDFAARVMSRLPAHRTLQYQLPARASVGRRVSMVAAAVLLIAVMAFAVQSGGANAATRTVVESIFALEFAALTVWLSLHPSQSL